MSKKNRNFQKYAEIFAEFDIEFLVTQKFAADLGYRPWELCRRRDKSYGVH